MISGMGIISVLQGIACAVLLVAAIRWQLKHPGQEDAYRFLFPFILTAALTGILLVAPWALELFAAYYSGSLYEMEVMSFRLDGPYGWVYCTGFVLPLLPVLGLIPAIGRRAVLVASIALLALLPVSFTPAVTLIQQFLHAS